MHVHLMFRYFIQPWASAGAFLSMGEGTEKILRDGKVLNYNYWFEN